ncbi:sigma-70 family RNA polymerase sigma factor [Brucella sp. NBRC 12950]|uniref:sigma-70 family RNA polymerase sigma factor n=1 Tax=Brucella sp. NBRC 12950 TaxID=2994518 RepID=UPI002552DC94|nr:sigma-70 family RNA polymerase sigma factor [Brucella sp. NBRC 12950]
MLPQTGHASGKAKAMFCRPNSNYVLQADDLVEMIPALRAFSRTFYKNKGDTEDLVQETLMKAIANREKYAPYSPLKSWLFTIMKNTFCTRLWIEKREAPGLEACVSPQLTIRASQESALEAKEVRMALGVLPEKYRPALMLVVFEGNSYHRTADICSCSVGTVKSRLHRARHKLHEIVDGVN